jgi:hypothetical protein
VRHVDGQQVRDRGLRAFDARVDAEHVGVVVDDAEHVRSCVSLPESLREHDRLQEAILPDDADELLRLRENRDVFDLQRDAFELLRRRRESTRPRSAIIEDAIDDRVEQFVVRALEHRPEREQLLFVALVDLARRDGCAPRMSSDRASIRNRSS